MKPFSQIMKAFRIPTLSPAGFLAWAVVLAAVYIVCRLVGLQAYASILSGTAPSGDPADSFSVMLGLIYVMVYFLSVIAAPILMISAGIFKVLLVLTARKTGDEAAIRR